MKISLIKESLRKATNGMPDITMDEGLVFEKERLQGMIKNGVHFCSLVTGYRGTGKSTFIKHVLDEVKEHEQGAAIIVKFNATKYDRYEIFIKRFIRELYLKCRQSGVHTHQLESLYLHTFFGIKETGYLLETKKQGEEEGQTENIQNGYDLQLDINKVIEQIGPFVFLTSMVLTNYLLEESRVPALVLYFLSLVVLFANKVISVNITKKKQKEKNSRLNKIDESEKTKKLNVETLYDDEIAEYHLYNEIKNLAKLGIKVIFVLDELDKIEDKTEIDRMFHDLKPLFLSSDCDVILIGGNNIEKYFAENDQELDTVSSNLFSHRVYIPLSTVKDMKDFSKLFYQEEPVRDEERVRRDRYLNKKIYDSKGVKRAFINGILSDIRWDLHKNPYADTNAEEIPEQFDLLFSVHEELEDDIAQQYSGPKRDEFILLLYVFIKIIGEKKSEVFSQDDILADADYITNKMVYTDTVEQRTLSQDLVEKMSDKGLLKLTKDGIAWSTAVKVPLESESTENDNTGENAVTADVERFLKNSSKMENVFFFFACFNGILSLTPSEMENITELQEDKLGEIVEEFWVDETFRFSDEMADILRYLNKLRDVGIEVSQEITDIRNYNPKIRMYIAYLLEYLLGYTYKKKLGLDAVCQPHGSRVGFDISTYDAERKRMIFTEVKYYKDYLQAFNHDMLARLSVELQRYQPNDGIEIESTELRIVVFSEGITEEGRAKFEFKREVLMKRWGYNFKIHLVDISDYNSFQYQMNNVLKTLA